MYKIHFAPMQGLNIAKYRELHCELFGHVNYYYSPFIATSSKAPSKKPYRDVLPENNRLGLDKAHVIPQLLGNDGEHFIEYAKYLTEMGYDTINWNLGCPSPTVTKKKKGSGLMAYPDVFQEALDIICSNKDFDLTIKLRVGLESVDEGTKIMNIMNEYPIKQVILHPRTGLQKYNGTVSHDDFEALYEICQHEIVYNGDINSLEDFQKVADRFPAIQHYMLGRGMLAMPYLPALIQGDLRTADEFTPQVRKLHDRMFNYYIEAMSGQKHVLDRMKEYWIYQSKSLDPTGSYARKIQKSKSFEDYKIAVDNMFSQ